MVYTINIMKNTSKAPKKNDWSWWDFEDEGSPDYSHLCDWCGAYVGRRRGSGKFVETSINLYGIRESGRLCSIHCKESWEKYHTAQITRINQMFPIKRQDKA